MNKFSAHRINTSEFLKNYIPGTFIRHKTGTLQDALIIHHGLAMLLPLRWPICHQLLSIHLARVYFNTGKGPTGAFDAYGALDDFKPRTGIHQPPHQPEVALRQDLPRPQPAYKALHGLFGHLVELDSCFSWSLKGTGCPDSTYWYQNTFSVELPSLAW